MHVKVNRSLNVFGQNVKVKLGNSYQDVDMFKVNLWHVIEDLQYENYFVAFVEQLKTSLYLLISASIQSRKDYQKSCRSSTDVVSSLLLFRPLVLGVGEQTPVKIQKTTEAMAEPVTESSCVLVQHNVNWISGDFPSCSFSNQKWVPSAGLTPSNILN